MNTRTVLTFALFLTMLGASFSFADGMIGDSDSIRARGGVGNYLFHQDYLEPGKTDAILAKKLARRGDIEAENVRDDSFDDEPTYGALNEEDAISTSASSTRIAEEKARSAEFGAIHFPAASAKIPKKEKKRLDRIANYLKEDPALSAQVVGYADAGGEATANRDLAESRAQNVVKQLRRRGVSESQLSWTARGESDPANQNDTAEGRAKNRRVEILFE